MKVKPEHWGFPAGCTQHSCTSGGSTSSSPNRQTMFLPCSLLPATTCFYLSAPILSALTDPDIGGACAHKGCPEPWPGASGAEQKWEHTWAPLQHCRQQKLASCCSKPPPAKGLQAALLEMCPGRWPAPLGKRLEIPRQSVTFMLAAPSLGWCRAWPAPEHTHPCIQVHF